MKFVITQLFALSRHFVLFGPVLHTEPFSRKSYCIRCFLKAVRHCCVYSQNQQITHEHAVYCNLYQQPHVSVILITIVRCTEENNCKLRRHLGLLQLILLKVNIKLAWEISGAFTGFFFRRHIYVQNNTVSFRKRTSLFFRWNQKLYLNKEAVCFRNVECCLQYVTMENFL